MNKKVFFIAVAMVLLIIGSLTFLLTRPSATPESNSQQNQSTTDQTTSKQAGMYVDYSQSVIAESSGTKLLFFYAPWCPQCRAIEEDITTQGVPSGVTIIKVDYDTNQKLRQKYGVTIQTTFIKIDDSGELISKFVAYEDPTLDSVIKNIL